MLTMMISGSLLTAGCRTFPQDQKAYPLQYEQTFHIPEISIFSMPVWRGPDKGYSLLEFHVQGSRQQPYAIIKDPVKDQTLDQIPFKLSSTVSQEDLIIVYSGKTDANLDGIDEVYFTMNDNSMQQLYKIDLKDNRIRPVLCLEKPDSFRNEIYDSRVYLRDCMKMDSSTSNDEYFCFIQATGYIRLPRKIIMYRKGDPPEEIFQYDFSSPISDYILVDDINRDGEEEFIFGTANPSNGHTFNGFIDSKSYIVALDKQGNLVWSTEFGEHGGQCAIARHPTDDTRLVAIDNWDALADANDITDVYMLNKSDGEILTKTTLPATVSMHVNRKTGVAGQLVALSVEDGLSTITILSVTCDTVISKTFPFPCRYEDVIFHPAYKDSLYKCHNSSLESYLLTKDLELVARLPFSTSTYYVFSSLQNPNSPLIRALKRDISTTIGFLVKKPWYIWWTWRWRWVLIGALVIPAALFGVFMLIRYIYARRKYTRELQQAYEQLNDLMAKVQTVQEDERKRVAKDLHDGMGNYITALKTRVEHINKSAANGTLFSERNINEVFSLLDKSSDEVHRIVYGLSPPLLEKEGLVAAIQEDLAMSEGKAGFEIDAALDQQLPRLQPDLEITLFRIYQEILNNIINHAKTARLVQIALYMEEDALILWIEDDGEGFDVSGALQKNSLGLKVMHQRLRPFGGRLHIISEPGKGSRFSGEIKHCSQYLAEEKNEYQIPS